MLNPSATKLLDEKIDVDPDHAAGEPVAEIVPELGPVLEEARASHMRTHQSQITLTAQGTRAHLQRARHDASNRRARNATM